MRNDQQARKVLRPRWPAGWAALEYNILIVIQIKLSDLPSGKPVD